MVNKNCACPQPPVKHEPKMPMIEPIVSVKSVNGMTGEVVLRDLIIGDIHYNGSDQKRITAADLGLGNAFRYCGAVKTIEKAEKKMDNAQCGDVYFCKEDEKFYLSIGEGEYRLFSNGQGGEPKAYLTDALVNAKTLTITKNDGSVIIFEDHDTIYDDTNIKSDIAKKQNKLTAGKNITIEGNIISAKGGTEIAGMYIGSVVRDAGNPAPQRNLIGLTRDNDVEDLEELKTKGYSNYIADNFSCACFAFPQSLGLLTSIQMNGAPFEMLPMFNRYDDYKAADGTKFYIYTFNQTVNPDYNEYTLKWN